MDIETTQAPAEAATTRKLLGVLAGGVAVVAAIAWIQAPHRSGGEGSDAGGGSDMTLSEAFCSDLKKGFTPYQILADTPLGKTPAQLADYAYGAASISCPDELKSNTSLRTYLQGWSINPDL